MAVRGKVICLFHLNNTPGLFRYPIQTRKLEIPNEEGWHMCRQVN